MRAIKIKMSRMWLMMVATLVVGGGGAVAESFLSGIGRSLRDDMADVLQMATVNYSEPVINATYAALVDFDMRAMGPLYNSTHAVIDVIANKQAYPKGLVVVADGHVEVSAGWQQRWRVLLAHYAGPLAFTVVAVLLVVVLPLAGLFWCCCYWCRGGRRRRPFDRKYDGCLKALLAIVLIALLTLFLLGVVCAFATDAQLEESVTAAPAAVRGSVADARTFLNATQAHARWLLVNNYRELERKLSAMLTSSGLTISMKLGEFTRAVSVTTLTGMVRELGAVQAALRDVQRLTGQLRGQAERLNAELRIVKSQLLRTLARCDQPACIRLQEKHKIGQLDTEIHYSQMPDVSSLLLNVTRLVEGPLRQEVEEGQSVFRGIQEQVQRSVDRDIPAAQDQLRDIGSRLEAVSSSISWWCGNASSALERGGGAAADGWRRAHARYGHYRRHGGRAAAAALLAVTCLLVWGVVCGVCGKRPDVYGAGDCCNKAAGSRALLCGMVVMFLVGGVIALVLLVYFLVGLTAQRLVCDPLTEPHDNLVFSDVERFIDLERALFNERQDPDFNVSYVLRRCEDNHTVYEAFQLRRRFDVRAIAAEESGAVRAAVSRLRPGYSADHVTILRPRARDQLLQLAATGLSDFDFDRILDALETNLTSLSLEALPPQLEAVSSALEGRPGFRDVARELRDAAGRLGRAHRDIVLPMMRDTGELNATALKLRDGLRFNHSSLKDAIQYLVHETAQAELFLNTQGKDLIQNITRSLGAVVSSLMSQYLARLSAGAERDVGRCRPLVAALNATRDAHCQNILMSLNGYWMSLSWCVVLFAPLMAVAQRLARLYLQQDPYPGPLVEAEYLYDAYADRDNVPLANAYKAEKRSSREARRGGGGGGGGGSGGAVVRAGGGGGGEDCAGTLPAEHARRYNDMAPKHWEEGPPRYAGPTEYERPPPYYYPGPHNDRQ